MCKLMISQDAFFIVLKFGFSQLLGGYKGKKMAQNDKKLSLSHSISQELYLVRLWFLVHFCKMMIPPAIFFIFSKF